MTNTALKGLVSQTQISAKVCKAWFGRVITLLGLCRCTFRKVKNSTIFSNHRVELNESFKFNFSKFSICG